MLVLGAPRKEKHSGYLSYFIPNFHFLLCFKRWQMPAPSGYWRRASTYCFAMHLNDFPEPGGRGIFIQFFKGFQRNSFRTEYFLKREGKREDPNEVPIPGGQFWETWMTLCPCKLGNGQTYLFPAHYFSLLSLFAILASFGSGHPESSPPVSIFWHYTTHFGHCYGLWKA